MERTGQGAVVGVDVGVLAHLGVPRILERVSSASGKVCGNVGPSVSVSGAAFRELAGSPDQAVSPH